MPAPSLIRKSFGVLLVSTVGLGFVALRSFRWIPLSEPPKTGQMRDTWVVDGEGRVQVATDGKAFPYVWSEMDRPEEMYVPQLSRPSTIGRRIWISKIQESPPRYLVSNPRLSFTGRQYAFWLVFVPWCVLSSAVGLGVLVLYLRRRGREVREVVARLKAGDLRARFKITKLDEIGKSMVSFNEMAEEIERLFERVRRAETFRRQMIRELSHDVRTPLTSLTYLVDTLADASRLKIPAALRGKLALARDDLSYLDRLVEDLFLLAETEDTGRERAIENVDPLELVEAELGRAKRAGTGRAAPAFRLVADLPGDRILSGERYLLRRLVGNAVDNARHFARRSVRVRMSYRGGGLEIRIRDDGPGFSAEGLAAFGGRRQSRFIDSRSTRVSLGLGSVIMKTVAELHGGTVSAGNWLADGGAVGGAEVTIRLPLVADGALGAAAPAVAA